ncbi:XRE family transcriptional regulator [Pseudomonas juntendi]|uniref:Helix-turn-helix transcriptional regulator n=1 Tax=Pseudomonas juntendi TaxID=2666183 RepID=A0A7W2QXB0_9PSED|nr:helix-turn-helix transcriptional regulator [Pseudomonas juntendi]MBA6097458.1 helix-turn-helix transcriptional regulator [Pseudomonas juntendi]MBA6130821.1 helix-turn-helix transcriptional regulator [Pseudomonas juntendi]MBA6146366.1 helix-turn-helix transcriptional regulator [Pseudomonas juntendi]
MTYTLSGDSDEPKKEHPTLATGIGRFKERLKEAMNGAAARGFARDCGLSEGAIRSYLSGETYPTLDRLSQIATASGVDPMWLAFGAMNTDSQDTSDDKYAYIPLYDAYISQGHGAWNEGARILAMLAFTRYSLRKKGLEPKQLAAVRVDGDSNEPELSEGDTVMVDLSRNHFQGEAFYVIRLNDLLYAKRLQREFDGSMSVISVNTAYHPVRVPVENLHSLEIVGRVVWAGGWMI